MTKNLLFAFYIFMLSNSIFAQHHLSYSNLKSSENQFLPKTVVFDLKPQYKFLIAQGLANQKYLSKIFKDIHVVKLEQLFPESSQSNLRQGGKNTVDLSTLFSITYSENQSIQNVINSLNKTGIVDFAEPQILEKILFIPNDPEADPTNGKQKILTTIKAYEAWEVEKGDTNVVIGIIDTDVNINHPDLKNRVKKNILDPINNIDDDKDGFLDNYQGWDIAEKDNDVRAKNFNKRITVKDRNGNDSIYVDTLKGNGHATMVTGCASADGNNGIGVIGTGFNTKFLPIKAMKDSSARTGGIIAGYQGIQYAASHGCKIINLSWGGGNNYLAAYQKVIKDAVFDHDVVIVAAAGNDSIEQSFYPASYDYVLSVAFTDTKFSTISNKNVEIKSKNASYSHDVDISCPGYNIFTTYQDNYNYNSGSSFASPYVAGAAALVRSKFPKWNAFQVMEQLRISADVIDTIPENKRFKEKIGKGRLNMYRALTDTLLPSIRMVANNYPDNTARLALSSDTIKLTCKFINYLKNTSGVKITISSQSPYVKILDSVFNAPSSLPLDTFTNTSKLFKFIINKQIPDFTKITFRLNYSNGSYNDYQYFHQIANPDYRNLDTNEVALTVTSNGRIGFNDGADNVQGLGFIYKNHNLLYEGGLMISSGPNKVSDCVRGIDIRKSDMDFVKVSSTSFVESTVASQEVYSEITEKISDKIGLQIIQNSYAWKDAPNNKFIIISYQIKNISDNQIDSLHVGIYSDWDILLSEENKSNYNLTTNTGFVYSTGADPLHAGVSLLSNQAPLCYSLDHGFREADNNINPNDGNFTTYNKYRTLSNGIFRPIAGIANSMGGDVSQVVGGSIYNFDQNKTEKFTFAIIAGDNLNDLLNSAKYAKIQSDKLNLISASDDILNTTIDLNIYPNPFNSTFKVSTNSSNTIQNITIQNIFGKEILYYKTPSTTSFSLNLSDEPSGVYVVKTMVNNKIFTNKIIKQ